MRLVFDYLVIRFSGLFDSSFYLSRYQEVRLADIDPLWHFIKYGWKEGRNPSEEFDTVYYLESYSDVRNINTNPLVHYILFGRKEGRKRNAIDVEQRTYSPKLSFARLFTLINIGNIRKGLLYGKHYGFTSLIKKIRYLSYDRTQGDMLKLENRIKIHESFITTPVKPTEIELKSFKSPVSIIIPTKNAGDEFELTLKMLKNQKGVEQIEIVIVDSGSSDNTIHLANRYDAKIVKIADEEFSHSYARNVGAENASGDYLLFTVQDALPPTQTWLYELMAVLFNNDVSAVSCAEFPREDADLFYRVISWNHYNFLGVNERDRILKLPAVSDFISLRQNGQLSDLACLIPTKVFMQYKYRFNYAEDLDLGIRLIKDGSKNAFLGSIRIIHSHNRPAYYFLKRGYVDNVFLSDMFSDLPIPKIKFKEFISEANFAYFYLNDVIIPNITRVSFPAKTGAIEGIIREGFKSATHFNYPPPNSVESNQNVDHEFTNFLEMLVHHSGTLRTGEQYNGYLINSLLNYTNIMFEYLNLTYEVVDDDLVEEISSCMNKELAILIGAHLAYCFINEPKNDTLGKVHVILTEGV